jgi:hypothetical protein
LTPHLHKSRLSYRDILTRDQRRRDLLGGTNPEFATPDALESAEILSELSVRVIEGPSWWKTSNGGIDLVDTTPLNSLYIQIMKDEVEALEAMKKKAEANKADLAKKE